MDLILSIGLNVGKREPAKQLALTELEVGALGGRLIAREMFDSEWEGTKERTVQYRLDFPLNRIELAIRMLSGLCYALKQECVAYTWGAHGTKGSRMENWMLSRVLGDDADGCDFATYPVRV